MDLLWSYHQTPILKNKMIWWLFLFIFSFVDGSMKKPVLNKIDIRNFKNAMEYGPYQSFKIILMDRKNEIRLLFLRYKAKVTYVDRPKHKPCKEGRCKEGHNDQWIKVIPKFFISIKFLNNNKFKKISN